MIAVCGLIRCRCPDIAPKVLMLAEVYDGLDNDCDGTTRGQRGPKHGPSRPRHRAAVYLTGEVTNGCPVRYVDTNGMGGFSGDGTPALSAQVDSPWGFEAWRGSHVLFVDAANRRVRAIW